MSTTASLKAETQREKGGRRHAAKVSRIPAAGNGPDAKAAQHAKARASERTVPATALRAAGKALRERLPLQGEGLWKRDKTKVDPIAILSASDEGRLENLLPIRYGRMLQSPFAFYRGSAAVMAADLANAPNTGLRVQACGDCHLLNFGGFATPERNILFDINDFDETLPAPWEWDVKRLVASFMLAARGQGISDSKGRDAAVACARSYRQHMREYAEMSPLEVWYARIADDDILRLVSSSLARASIRARVAAATSKHSSETVYPKLAGMVGGRVQIHDHLPLIYHPTEMSADEFHQRIHDSLQSYRETLSDDRRELLDQYRLVDGAVKVVGIGSVGTRCFVILLMSASNDPLFLQWKEARASVLEPFAGPSAYSHPGERVVNGQRLMQPATDVFLGWATTKAGRMGYVRQLRDAKIKPLVEAMDAKLLVEYAVACGWVLARAHAKASSVELQISGYLGPKDRFDEAMGSFAVTYADQAERDHNALKAAVRAGRIKVQLEE